MPEDARPHDVGGDQNRRCHRDSREHPDAEIEDQARQVGRLDEDGVRDAHRVGFHEEVADDADQAELEHGLQELDLPLHAEHALPAARHRDARHLGHDAVDHDAGWILQGRGENAGDAEHDHDRHDEFARLHRHRGEEQGCIGTVLEREIGRLVEDPHQRRREFADARGEKEARDQKHADQGCEGRRFARDGDIALLDGVLDLLLGRLFCFTVFVGLFGHATGPRLD